MARQRRITIENGVYHILLRGNNKKLLFHTNNDKIKFYSLMTENIELYDIYFYHYVLMDNHVHFIIYSPIGQTLSEFIKRLCIQYVMYYRKKYGGVGHFFQNRYKSFLIQKGRYLLECGKYIELNPVRAGIIKYAEQYQWSSCTSYISDIKNNLITYDPEYMALSEDKLQRQMIYKGYLKNSEIQKNEFQDFYKIGAYGSLLYKNQLREKGILRREKKMGRPKKREDMAESSADPMLFPLDKRTLKDS